MEAEPFVTAGEIAIDGRTGRYGLTGWAGNTEIAGKAGGCDFAGKAGGYPHIHVSPRKMIVDG
jgi:hypothetical protein